ncbi:MAG: hypothetical protein EPN48_01820 [Microbacteriaceae bacterium]|nr:MAG: hypothetical protein EPN48_01820 [Microbacteriaceae bacterium]
MPTLGPNSAQIGDLLVLPAFVISIVAALVGASALIWNIVAWVRSGHRVVVEVEVVVRNPGRNASWTGRRGRLRWPVASIPPRHVDYSIVFATVVARNRGRAPVDIERFYFTVGRASENRNISWTMVDDPPLPQRLDPGSSTSREYMIGEVEAFVRREKRHRFRGAVALGDGRQRRSRRGFNIDKRGRGDAFLASPTGQTLNTPAPSEQ